MYFTDLDLPVKKAIAELPKDGEFQKRFGFDKILDDLEAERYDKKRLVNELQAFKGIPIDVRWAKIQSAYYRCLDNTLGI